MVSLKGPLIGGILTWSSVWFLLEFLAPKAPVCSLVVLSSRLHLCTKQLHLEIVIKIVA
jgi:hypothetical protein